MTATMRLSVIIDGQTREATVAVNQVTAALDKLGNEARSTGPAAANAMKQAGQGAADASRLSAQQLGAMQFQLQDIAVGLTSGQSPFTVMMQQGSQLAQSFTAGTGVIPALKAVGQGLVQFVTNPLNLAVLGFGLAATAAQQFFQAVAGDTHTVDTLLDAHADFIKQIGEEWDKAKGKAEGYAKALTPAMLLEAQLRSANLEEAVSQARAGIQPRLLDAIQSRTSAGDQLMLQSEGGLEAFKQIVAAIQEAGPGLESGAASAEDLTARIRDIATAAPESALGLRNFALELIGGKDAMGETVNGVLSELTRTEKAFNQNESAIKLIKGTAEGADKAMLGLDQSARSATGSIDGLSRSLRNIPSNIQGYGFGGASPADLDKKSLLDLIGHTEGTDIGRGYNETLGYGKFTGGPVDLVAMTLNQVLELQRQMLANPANTFHSSALGRYQITSETLKDFMPKLGLTGDTLFSKDVQDKIALAIIQDAGRNFNKLEGRWPSLKTQSESRVLAAFDNAGADRGAVVQDMSAVTLKNAAAAKSWGEAIASVTDHSNLLTATIGKTAAETARARTEQSLWNQAERIFGDELKTNARLHDEVAASITKAGDAAAAAAGKQEASAKALETYAKNSRDMARAQQAFYENFRGLFDGVVTSIAQAREAGDSWTKALGAGLDTLKDKALSILDNFISKALDMALLGPPGSSGGGLLGGLFGSLFGGLSNPLQNAFGNAFDNGSVTAFASGGVFTSPMAFPMRGGTGVFAEAGPEAIMPLQRMASGHLGVRAAGNGSGVNVTVNNNAGADVRTRSSQRSDGGIDIELLLTRKIDEHLGREDVVSGLAQRMGTRVPAQIWG